MKTTAVKLSALALLCVGALRAQSPNIAGPGGAAELNNAYQALKSKNYDDAIVAFRHALDPQSQRDNPMTNPAAAYKDLAYTLLKTGDNIEAREAFGKAIELDPHDETAALEYAFLCYETGKPVEARRTFKRLRQHSASPATRATAERAFENIDKPLGEGIARWRQTLAKSAHPDDISLYSVHWELARLAEQRDELQLAAEQYEICRKLKPQVSSLLLDLARVWQQLNEVEQAHAALLAASRSTESRTAENALERLGPRYPYVYEFENAVRLDPSNIALRRELAYLFLALGKETEAIRAFEQVLNLSPDDHLSIAQLAALRHGAISPAAAPAAVLVPTAVNSTATPVKPNSLVPSAGTVARSHQLLSSTAAKSPEKTDPKILGKKSLAAGFVNDAIRYLSIAHENNPGDSEVMLQLGWAYNVAKQDHEAIHWFDAARHSTDKSIAAEATRAWHNLRGDVAQQTTVWALPMYSSRWNDAFTYGQIKRSLPWRIPGVPAHLYLSTRFIGDAKGKATVGNIPSQYLSESSFIFGAGIATKQWRHLLGWAEAGEAVNYLPGRHDVGKAIPDYRAGVNFAKGFGSLLGAKHAGFFYETTADAIYISRFDKDTLFYSQNRIGHTNRLFGGDSFQVYGNANYVRDLKSQYWANTVEFGPGLRIHFPWLPSGVYFSADWLRGVYTTNFNNPRRPNFTDLRLSFWYAASK